MGENLLKLPVMEYLALFPFKREDLFGTKNLSKDIEIGDEVMVISLEGKPIGKLYDITGDSYWVDLEKFGKMEFSKDELKVMV